MIAAADSEDRSHHPEKFRGRRPALALLVCAIAAAACRGGDPRGPIEINIRNDGTRVELTGLPIEVVVALRADPPRAGQWNRILSVYVVGDHATASAPALFGQYALDGSVVAFTPRFPLRAGLAYRVVFDPSALPNAAQGGERDAEKIETVLELPAENPRPPTKITAVYPSGDELPENLLKFYIHFSAPMSPGEAYERIRIVDAQGRDVPDAFLRLGEELWDADARRLTLLFDPGRIKRGLKPNEEVGAPLMSGRSYALAIDPAWRDAHRAPLAKGYRRNFRVTPFDDAQPDPDRWKITSPHAGTRTPLVVEFNEPLDHALLEHSLVVRGPQEEEIAGSITIDKHETRWQFTPAKPWAAGQHTLVVDPILEDRAGNSVGRLFETQTQEVVDQGTSAEPVTLHFTIP